MKHHPTCSPDYPEKLPNEAPQAITKIDLGDAGVAHVCVDCGATEIVK